MPIPSVFARPERLQAFGATAGALADGLAWRLQAVRHGAREYATRTEPAFEVPVDDVLDAVGELGRAVRELGEWVGRVGDAFAHLPTAQGVAFDFGGMLAVAARPGDGGGDGEERSLADQVEVIAGGALAGLRAGTTAAASGAATASGAGGVAGRVAAAGAARHPFVTASQLLAAVMALRAGMGEVTHRWHAEQGRPTWERAGRAGLDGGLNAAGMFAGAMAGGAAAAALCSGAGPVATGCAPVGASLGSDLGRRAGELAGDVLLGGEPEPWERDPAALVEEIADLDPGSIGQLVADLDEVVAGADDLASRHNAFVMEHPWVWADTYHDAPDVVAPCPAPFVPAAGPR